MITITWTTERDRQLPAGGDKIELTSGLLNIDIIESDLYDASVSITEHSVDEGSPTTDHVVQNSDRQTITAIVSDRPIRKDLYNGVESGSVLIRTGEIVSGLIAPNVISRKADVHDELLRLMKNAIRVDVEGLQRPLEQWLIESVSAPRSVDTASLLVCDVSFLEFRTSVLEEVEAPSPRVERGRNRRDNGRSRTSDEDENSTASNETRSVARQLTDRLLGG